MSCHEKGAPPPITKRPNVKPIPIGRGIPVKARDLQALLDQNGEYMQIIVALSGKLIDYYCETCGKFALTGLKRRPPPEDHLPGLLCSDCLYMEATNE